MLCWNDKSEQLFCDLVYPFKYGGDGVGGAMPEADNADLNGTSMDPSNGLMQCKICMPSNRSVPILIVLSLYNITVSLMFSKKTSIPCKKVRSKNRLRIEE